MPSHIPVVFERGNRTVFYAMSTPEDLEETIRLVEDTGRRIVGASADVRDFDVVATVVQSGVAQLGRLDVFCANAGMMPSIGQAASMMVAWVDGIDVLLTGVLNTVRAAVPWRLGAEVGQSSSPARQPGSMPSPGGTVR